MLTARSLSSTARRSRTVLRWVIATLFVLGVTGARASRAQTDGQAVKLTILHTNDLHGHILPFAYTEVGRRLNELPSVGGAARRATLVRRIRASAGNPVIVIDSGDTFTRGPFTTTYRGLADVEAMNAVGYDLAAIGNNEFKARDASEANDAAGAQTALLSVVKHSRFTWLCANCTDQHGAILEGVQPFVVRQMGPVRVGFLGLTAPRVASYPQAKGWTIIDPVAAARTYIPLARAQCDILIAVTHIGLDLDKKLAAKTTGIDAVVGGDSHTFLYKPLTVKNADRSASVPIVQDGEFGANLGRLDLTLSRSASGWHITEFHDELLPVGPTLPEAPDVVAAVQPFAGPLMEVVGTLPMSLVGQTGEDRLLLTTRVIVDALRRQTGADYALSPAGDGIWDVFRAATVRRYDIAAVLPFKDIAVVATLTGAELQALLATRKDTGISGNPKTIQPGATYRVAMVDFFARTEYKIDDGKLRDTGRIVYDLLRKDIRENYPSVAARKP